MLWVAAARAVLSVLPIAVALTLFGADLDSGVRVALIAAVGVGLTGTVSEAYQWLTARYRVTAERVELRTGLLTRNRTWVPRDRVRTVNVKARPLHRLFDLAAVRIGTGESGGSSERSGLMLDAIRAGEAERLRTALLERSPVAPGSAKHAAAGPQLRHVDEADEAPASGAITDRSGATVGRSAADRSAAPPETSRTGADAEGRGRGATLARFRWRYIGYELLAWWTLLIPALAAGTLYQSFRTTGINPEETGVVTAVTDAISSYALGLVIVGLPLALITLGAAATLAYSLERWWDYRLERQNQASETLVVRHGLFTRRSKDLEIRRLRGIEVLETPLLRLARGAIVNAVISGLAQSASAPGESPKALGPSMPRSEASRIGADVLDEGNVPTDPDGLRAHPAAAKRRRRLRGLAAAAGTGIAAAVVSAIAGAEGTAAGVPLAIGAAATVIALPVGLLLAADNYRALGNRLTARFLVARHGLLQRRTVALEREGIIGWTVRRTLFQRRAGLATLTATTAAGNGSYSAPDMAASDAVDLADRAVPDLLAPFLVTAGSADGLDAPRAPWTR